MSNLSTILQEFCSASRFVISLENVRVFFTNNILENTKPTVCNQLAIRATDDLGKYLGCPIAHSRFSKRHVQFIVDKVKAKLANWQVHMIFSAGRKSIIQQVTTAIPSYYMQCLPLPTATYD
ncbi:hypothetical protein ACH5RR_013078 [Cinchona calisaya]|uniref:Uncharacterized protein n=1 Tax=Cinchona calisaya TaxID=153742 RepID=A0ABD2ZZ24_9GENT